MTVIPYTTLPVNRVINSIVSIDQHIATLQAARQDILNEARSHDYCVQSILELVFIHKTKSTQNYNKEFISLLYQRAQSKVVAYV